MSPVNGQTQLSDAHYAEAEAWLDAHVEGKTAEYAHCRDLAVFHSDPTLGETLEDVKEWIEDNMEAVD